MARHSAARAEREPLEPIDSDDHLTPDDFKIPERRCFTPPELAHYLLTDARSIIRLIEEGSLKALSLGHGRYKIPYSQIVKFLEHGGVPDRASRISRRSHEMSRM